MNGQRDSGTGQAVAMRGVSQSQLLATHHDMDRDALLQLITTRSTDDYLFADRLLKNFTISDIPFEDGTELNQRDEPEGRTMNASLVNQGFYFDDDDILANELDPSREPGGMAESTDSNAVSESCLVQRSLFSSTHEEEHVQLDVDVTRQTAATEADEALVGPDERESARRAAQLDKAAMHYRLVSSVMTASSMTQSLALSTPAPPASVRRLSDSRCAGIHNPLFDSCASGAPAPETQTTWRAIAAQSDTVSKTQVPLEPTSACERQWTAWRLFRAARDQAPMSASLVVNETNVDPPHVPQAAHDRPEGRVVTWKQVGAARRNPSPRKATTWRDLKATYQDADTDAPSGGTPLALRAPKFRYSMTLLELYQRTMERQRLEPTVQACATQTSEGAGPVGWFERLFSQLDASGNAAAVMTQSTPADDSHAYALFAGPPAENTRATHSLSGTAESQSDCSVLNHVGSTGEAAPDAVCRTECAVQTMITIPSVRARDAERMRRALAALGRNVNVPRPAQSHRPSLTHRLPDLHFLRRCGGARLRPNERETGQQPANTVGKSPSSLTSSSGFSSTSCCSNVSGEQQRLAPTSTRARAPRATQSGVERCREADDAATRPTHRVDEPCEELSQSAHADVPSNVEEDASLPRVRIVRQTSTTKPRKSVSFNQIIEFHSPSPNPSSSPEQSPSRCGSSQLAASRASQGRMRLAMSIPDLVQLQVECPPLEFATHESAALVRVHSPGTLRALRTSTSMALVLLGNEPPLRSKLRVFVNDLLSGVDLIAKHFTLVEMVGFSCSHVCAPSSGRPSESDSATTSGAASKIDVAALQRKLDRVFLEYFVVAVHQLLGDQLLIAAAASSSGCSSLSPTDTEKHAANASDAVSPPHGAYDYWTFLTDAYAPSIALSSVLSEVDATFRSRLESAFRPSGSMPGTVAARAARSSVCSSSGTPMCPDAAYLPTLKLILLLARVLNDGLLFDFFDVLFAAATSHVVERHYRASSALHVLHQLLVLEFELAGSAELRFTDAEPRSEACRNELHSLHETTVRQLRELFSHLERLRRVEFALDGDALMRQFVDEQERLAASGGCCSIATSPSNNTLSTQYAVPPNTAANAFSGANHHYATPFTVVRSSGAARPATHPPPFDPAVGLSLALSAASSRKASFIPVRVGVVPSHNSSPTAATAQPVPHTASRTVSAPASGAAPSRGSPSARTPHAAPGAAQHATTSQHGRSADASPKASAALPTARATVPPRTRVAPRTDQTSRVAQPHSRPVTSGASTKPPSPRSTSGASSTAVSQTNAAVSKHQTAAAPSFVQRLYQRMRFTNKK